MTDKVADDDDYYKVIPWIASSKSSDQKTVKISALTTKGRNPDNFLFVFWEKR